MSGPTPIDFSYIQFVHQGMPCIPLAAGLTEAARNELVSDAMPVIANQMDTAPTAFTTPAIITKLAAEVLYRAANDASVVTVHTMGMEILRSVEYIYADDTPEPVTDVRTTYATNVVINLLSVVRARLDGGGGPARLRIYSGAVPTRADSPLLSENVMLAELYCSHPMGAVPTGNLLTFGPIEPTLAVASGTATFYRACDSNGNVVYQGNVTDVVGSKGCVLQTVALQASGPVTVTSAQISFYQSTTAENPECEEGIDEFHINLPTPLPTVPAEVTAYGNNLTVTFSLQSDFDIHDPMYGTTVIATFGISTNDHALGDYNGIDEWVTVMGQDEGFFAPDYLLRPDFMLYMYRYDTTLNQLQVKVGRRFNFTYDQQPIEIRVRGDADIWNGIQMHLDSTAEMRLGCGEYSALQHYADWEGTSPYSESGVAMVDGLIYYIPIMRLPEQYSVRIGNSTDWTMDNQWSIKESMLEVIPPNPVAGIEQPRIYNNGFDTSYRADYDDDFVGQWMLEDPKIYAHAEWYAPWDSNGDYSDDEGIATLLHWDNDSSWCYEWWQHHGIQANFAGNGGIGEFDFKLWYDHWRDVPNYSDWWSPAPGTPTLAIDSTLGYGQKKLFRATIGEIDVCEGAAGIWLDGTLPMSGTPAINWRYVDFISQLWTEHTNSTGTVAASATGTTRVYYGEMHVLFVTRIDIGTGTVGSATINNGWAELTPPVTVDLFEGGEARKVTRYAFYKFHARGTQYRNYSATFNGSGLSRSVWIGTDYITIGNVPLDDPFPFVGINTEIGEGVVVNTTLNPEDMEDGAFITHVTGIGKGLRGGGVKFNVAGKWESADSSFGAYEDDQIGIGSDVGNSNTQFVDFVLRRPYEHNAQVAPGTVENCVPGIYYPESTADQFDPLDFRSRIVTTIGIKQSYFE